MVEVVEKTASMKMRFEEETKNLKSAHTRASKEVESQKHIWNNRDVSPTRYLS